MKHVFLIRSHFDDEQTLGNLLVVEGHEVLFHCKTLELAYRHNRPRVSSIPEGTYDLVSEHSPRFQERLYTVLDVPGRTGIRIHVGNFHHQLAGCILLGREFHDIDSDGLLDLTHSRVTLNQFHSTMAYEPAKIHIITTKTISKKTNN